MSSRPLVSFASIVSGSCLPVSVPLVCDGVNESSYEIGAAGGVDDADVGLEARADAVRVCDGGDEQRSCEGRSRRAATA
jgi:hypothetical protein